MVFSAITWATIITLNNSWNIIKLRQSSTFYMRYQSPVHMLQGSKNRNTVIHFCCKNLKNAIVHLGVFLSFPSFQISKWYDYWCIKKLTQRAIAFVFGARVSLASIIKKFAVKVDEKNRVILRNYYKVQKLTIEH